MGDEERLIPEGPVSKQNKSIYKNGTTCRRRVFHSLPERTSSWVRKVAEYTVFLVL